MNQQLLANKYPVCSFMFLEPDKATNGVNLHWPSECYLRRLEHTHCRHTSAT